MGGLSQGRLSHGRLFTGKSYWVEVIPTNVGYGNDCKLTKSSRSMSRWMVLLEQEQISMLSDLVSTSSSVSRIPQLLVTLRLIQVSMALGVLCQG